MSHLFSVYTTGTHVDVAPVAKKGKPNSEGGAAYIIGINKSDNGNRIESVDDEYVTIGVRKKLSKGVDPSRLKLRSIQTLGRRDGLPSILSPLHATAKRAVEATVVDDQPKKPKRPRNNQKNTDDLLLMPPQDVHKYMSIRNNKHQFGWFRLVEAGMSMNNSPLSSLKPVIS